MSSREICMSDFLPLGVLLRPRPLDVSGLGVKKSDGTGGCIQQGYKLAAEAGNGCLGLTLARGPRWTCATTFSSAAALPSPSNQAGVYPASHFLIMHEPHSWSLCASIFRPRVQGQHRATVLIFFSRSTISFKSRAASYFACSAHRTTNNCMRSFTSRITARAPLPSTFPSAHTTLPALPPVAAAVGAALIARPLRYFHMKMCPWTLLLQQSTKPRSLTPHIKRRGSRRTR